MSALAQFADSSRTSREVREVPLPAVSSCSNIRVRKPGLLDHLVGDAEQRRGDGQSQTTWGICKPPVNATIAMVGKPALHAAQRAWNSSGIKFPRDTNTHVVEPAIFGLPPAVG
jgi:hypothetical protein